MGRITDTAGDIIRTWKAKPTNKGPVPLHCMFCKAHVESDAPDSVWFGYDTFGRQYDGHDKCDAIAKPMEDDARFLPELEAFFDRLGIPREEHKSARRVLLWRIKRDL